jgi:hypothetical protein
LNAALLHKETDLAPAGKEALGCSHTVRGAVQRKTGTDVPESHQNSPFQFLLRIAWREIASHSFVDKDCGSVQASAKFLLLYGRTALFRLDLHFL